MQPSMAGYCLNIEGTDVHYEVAHAEVLGDSFNIGRVLNIMCAAKDVKASKRSSLFRDTSLNKRQSIMLHTTRLMAGAVRKQKHTEEMEGASSIEKTSMCIKDHSRKVPEPVVVLAKINGQQV